MKTILTTLTLALTLTGCTWPGIDNKNPPKHNPYYGESAVAKTLDDPPNPPGFTNGCTNCIVVATPNDPFPPGSLLVYLVPPITQDANGHFVVVTCITNTVPGVRYNLQRTRSLTEDWLILQIVTATTNQITLTNIVVTAAGTNQFFRARQLP